MHEVCTITRFAYTRHVKCIHKPKKKKLITSAKYIIPLGMDQHNGSRLLARAHK